MGCAWCRSAELSHSEARESRGSLPQALGENHGDEGAASIALLRITPGKPETSSVDLNIDIDHGISFFFLIVGSWESL